MPTIVCDKKRIGDKRVVSIREGDPRDRDVLIVDDLIQSGGTIRESARVLREAGARSVSAYATHGIFPGDSHHGLLSDLDRLYVTDSVPLNRERFSVEPRAEVLSIAPLVSRMVANAA